MSFISGDKFLYKLGNLINKNEENCNINLKKIELPSLNILNKNNENNLNSPCTVQQINEIITRFNNSMGPIVPNNSIEIIDSYSSKTYKWKTSRDDSDEFYFPLSSDIINNEEHNILSINVKVTDVSYAYSDGKIGINIYDNNNKQFASAGASWSIWNADLKQPEKIELYIPPNQDINQFRIEIYNIKKSDSHSYEFEVTCTLKKFIVTKIPELEVQ